MIVLALDTSGPTASLALLAGEGPPAEILIQDRSRPEAGLGANARDLLASKGLTARDLAAVAVGLGPGSYTGIRIAVAFAKTLAYSGRIPLVGLSGLAARAWEVRAEGSPVLVLEPAHRQAHYAALYDVGGSLPIEILAPALVSLPGASALAPPGAIVTGSAASLVSSPLRAVPGPPRVRASTLAGLARLHLSAGLAPADPWTLEPLYLQAAAPERTP